MRITAEYISDQNRLLVRLLSTTGSPVQVGTYLIDGTPQILDIQDVEVMAGNIKNDEVDLYFAGYYPYPKQIKVTLPDTTVVTAGVQDFINLSSVVQHGPEILSPQPSEALMPDEPSIRFEGESASLLRPVEVMEKPQVPAFWLDLNFEQSNPITAGAGLTTPALSYSGGGIGRALDSSHRQPSADSAPWTMHAPLRLEGGFTNLLAQSSLYPTRPVIGMFDPIPVGWDVIPTDPNSLVRVQTSSGGISIPYMTLTYTPRTNGVPHNDALTVITPPIPAHSWFQIIAAPSAENDIGSLQMKTSDGLVTSSVYSLNVSSVARFNVGASGGRVSIIWTQKTDGQPQTLRLYGPICSNYGTAHSWIPPLVSSLPDVVMATGLSSANKWSLNQGSIRIDSTVEDQNKPFSWNIEVGSSSLLRLNGGVLSSDFSTSAIDITPLVGTYNLVWSSPTVFSVQSTVNGQLVSTPIAFSLDLISNVDLTAPINVELTACSSAEGTAIVKLFKFSPT